MLTVVEAVAGGLELEGRAVSGLLCTDGVDWMAGAPKGLKMQDDVPMGYARN